MMPTVCRWSANVEHHRGCAAERAASYLLSAVSPSLLGRVLAPRMPSGIRSRVLEGSGGDTCA